MKYHIDKLKKELHINFRSLEYEMTWVFPTQFTTKLIEERTDDFVEDKFIYENIILRKKSNEIF